MLKREKLFLLCLLTVLNNVLSENRIVRTVVDGEVLGQLADDGDYYMFLGIPYAVVNSSNPFGPSAPVVDLGTFNATDDSAKCPQVDTFGTNTIVGTLDCLHLNVYVPRTANPTNLLPVIVWIHGGGFSTGSGGRSFYGPKFIVKHDVILVTINYRLGPYGFLCLDIPEVAGNQGLKDQLIALRWVKSNIGAFNGDDNKITVMGESAGSASVHIHLVSPQEDLFNQAILQSGTAMVATQMGSDASSVLELAQNLGHTTNDIYDALSFLSDVNPHDVIRVGVEKGFSYGVCTENKFNGVENIIVSHPINTDVPKAKNKNIMIGFNSDEAITMLASMSDVAIGGLKNTIFRSWLNSTFILEEDELNQLDKIFKDFYTGDATFNDQIRFQLTDFLSDVSFVYPTERAIKSFLDNGAANIYYYLFSYVGGRNFYKAIFNVTVGGASHADELGYLFNMAISTITPTTEDQRLIDQMTTMWTNFAKFGNPTPETTDLLPVKWEPVKENTPHHYLHIDSTLTAEFKPFRERTAFWDLFYNAYYKNEITYPQPNSATVVSSVAYTTIFIAFLITYV